MHLGIPIKILSHTLHKALIARVCTSHTSPTRETATVVSTAVAATAVPTSRRNMLGCVHLYYAIGSLLWWLLGRPPSVLGHGSFLERKLVQVPGMSLSLPFSDETKLHNSVNQGVISRNNGEDNSDFSFSRNMKALSHNNLRLKLLENSMQQSTDFIPFAKEIRNSVIHSGRFKRNSFDETTPMNPSKNSLFCNNRTRYSCQCFACDTKATRTVAKGCCEDTIDQAYVSEAVVLSLNTGINSVNNSWVLENNFAKAVTQSIATYCSHDGCNLRLGTSLSTSFLPENVIIIKLVPMPKQEQDDETIPVSESQGHWIDVVFAVIAPAEAVDKGQVNGNKTHLPLPADVLQRILENETPYLNTMLNLRVSSEVLLWTDYNAPDDITTSGPTLPPEKDLPMTGIVFGGIFAFLFFLTCLASVRKAIK